MANQIVWCDIPVKDLDRAIIFYSAVLGRTVAKHSMEGMTFGLLPDADNGVSGCLVVGAEHTPSTSGPMIYLNCANRLDAAIATIEKNGGKILQPKHQIGPHGFRAVALDSEGNRIALHST
ncbi:MAG TPA: VOC family protein [Verrucomicrobiae bacterium]|nr:VOC family protein [Verrucomicrobiae bacterium]